MTRASWIGLGAAVATCAAVVASVKWDCDFHAQQDVARLQVAVLSGELESYKRDHGDYPPSDLGLHALPRGPDGLVDPWHLPFHYEIPGTQNPQGYDLYTYGADSLPGGEGDDADIGNWVSE